jgi:tRNA (mo5U34)-methyltransferase
VGVTSARSAGGEPALDERIRALGPWFHDLDLAGTRTAPDHPLGTFLQDLWSLVEPAFPRNMTGMSVLDIGCNAGFYSFQLHARGARVLGVDHDPRYLEQARLAAQVKGAEVDFAELDVYDLDRLNRTYDYVLFMGVLYHLRHPLYALERVARRVGRRLVLQSMVRGSPELLVPPADFPLDATAPFEDPRFPALYFIERSYGGDATNWFVPNESGLAALIRSCGLVIEEHRRPGVYFCAPGGRPRDGAS